MRARNLLLTALLVGATPSLQARAPSAAAQQHKEKGDSLARRDPAAAEKAYRRAMAVDPGYFEAVMGVGEMLFAQRRFHEAAEAFQHARAIKPQHDGALYNLAYAVRKAGRHVEAMEHYRRYVERKPEDPDGFFGLAESEQAAGFGREAARHYRHYVELEKRPSEQKWVERARERAEALEREYAAVPALDDEGAAVARAEPPAPAAAPSRTAPPDDGARTAAVAEALQQGDAALTRNAFADAHAAYHRALKADPDNVEAYARLGLTYALAGDPAHAAVAFTRARTLAGAPAGDDVAQPPAAAHPPRFRITDATVASAAPAPQANVQPSAATSPPPAAPAPTLSRTERLSAANVVYNHAVALLRQGDYDGALRELDRALSIKPDHALAYVARGTTLMALKRPDDAAAAYAEALRHDPSLAAPHYGLGEAYRLRGDRARAREAYARYLSSQGLDKEQEVIDRAARSYADLAD